MKFHDSIFFCYHIILFSFFYSAFIRWSHIILLSTTDRSLDAFFNDILFYQRFLFSEKKKNNFQPLSTLGLYFVSFSLVFWSASTICDYFKAKKKQNFLHMFWWGRKSESNSFVQRFDFGFFLVIVVSKWLIGPLEHLAFLHSVVLRFPPGNSFFFLFLSYFFFTSIIISIWFFFSSWFGLYFFVSHFNKKKALEVKTRHVNRKYHWLSVGCMKNSIQFNVRL